jgi:hypothetical protein
MLREECINVTIARADCKQIGLHSGFGRVRATYLKVNIGLGSGKTDTGKSENVIM